MYSVLGLFLFTRRQKKWIASESTRLKSGTASFRLNKVKVSIRFIFVRSDLRSFPVHTSDGLMQKMRRKHKRKLNGSKHRKNRTLYFLLSLLLPSCFSHLCRSANKKKEVPKVEQILMQSFSLTKRWCIAPFNLPF